MGNPFLLQACLRLDTHDIPQPFEIGKKYRFTKNGHRLYQINIPMDLRDKDWNVFGRCVITEYTVGNNKTVGTYVMAKILNEEQRKQVTDAYVADEEVNTVLAHIQ